MVFVIVGGWITTVQTPVDSAGSQQPGVRVPVLTRERDGDTNYSIR